MGVLRDLLLVLNRNGRALSGSAAYPEPAELHVPQDLKDAVDMEAPDSGDAHQGH